MVLVWMVGIVVVLVALDVLSMRYGADSRRVDPWLTGEQRDWW